MYNYFFKLNRKYLEEFSRAVIRRYRTEDISSDKTFLKSLFKELNKLFRYIGGKISTKDDIPSRDDYPDSKKFNKLLEDISADLDKLYTSQRLVEDDVNNLLNFNASQRIRTFENISNIQQDVYSIYIKNKNITGSELTIPSNTPFGSSDNLDSDSSNVYIDETSNILTLAHESSVVKPVDIENVKIFFSNEVPAKLNLYPNNRHLGLGSHWDIPGKSGHRVNVKNKSDILTYKGMLIDDVNSNTGVGWCEFEAILTFISDDVLTTIKTRIGEANNKDTNLIYTDIKNSLQGKYITYDAPSDHRFKYKLTIPFNNAPPTNEITIGFVGNSNGFIPSIDWGESKVFSDTGGTDTAHSLIKPPSTDKPASLEYRCRIRKGFIKPTRMEVILTYGSDSEQWLPFPWNMNHYVYHATKNYVLPQEGSTNNISLLLKKSYDIYVDSEPDKVNEKTRALNVLRGI